MTYYKDLATYSTAAADAKGFLIAVELKNGNTITSSPLPIAQLDSMLEVVETTDVLGMIVIWNKQTLKLQLIPMQNVQLVSFVFL